MKSKKTDYLGVCDDSTKEKEVIHETIERLEKLGVKACICTEKENDTMFFCHEEMSREVLSMIVAHIEFSNYGAISEAIRLMVNVGTAVANHRGPFTSRN